MRLIFLSSRCASSPHGALATVFRMYPSVPLIDSSESYVEVTEPPLAYYEYIDAGDTNPSSCVVISGARQSPSYFPKEVGALIPDWDFALGGHVVRSLLERDAGLDSVEERRRTISVHVRLGDYKLLEHHQQDLDRYYLEALKKVEPGSRLHLFSDEPHLCADIFFRAAAERGVRLTVARVRADVESLYEMSLCLGGNIVANSTFSWWGAWLAHQNGSPWATYPSNWGKGMPEPTSLFPEWGIIVPV